MNTLPIHLIRHEILPFIMSPSYLDRRNKLFNDFIEKKQMIKETDEKILNLFELRESQEEELNKSMNVIDRWDNFNENEYMEFMDLVVASMEYIFLDHEFNI